MGASLYDENEIDLGQRKVKEISSHPAVVVRRARYSDYPAIAIFLREAYGAIAPFKAKDRWAWQFKNNPYTTSPVGCAPVWIAELSGTVVGQIAVQEGSIEIDGTRRPAGWVVDVMILPSYRGLGLGHQLFAAVAKDYPLLVTLTMAPATRRMANRLGAVEFGKVELYSRLLNLDEQITRRYFRVRTRHRPRVAWVSEALCTYMHVDRIVAHVGNLLLLLENAFSRLPRTKNVAQIVEVERFGSEMDALWKTLSTDFPVAIARDSKFLNWRFCECPQMEYRCFQAIRDNKVVGYLVLRRTHAAELPEGIIADLVAAREDRETVGELIGFALEWFGNSVAAIECASSIPEFATTLRKFRFHRVRTERPNAVVADSEVRKRIATSSGDWLLSKADHDWDQIRPAER
jgi:GNAT superfamily N-acetyltransferase